MDSPLYAWNKNIVKTVDCKGGTGSKNIKIRFFGWESNDDCFLGELWNYPNRLPSKRENQYRSILYIITWRAEGNCKISGLMQKKKILFHQHNALSHTSTVAMAKIHELPFELLNHRPYSPDLAPSDLLLCVLSTKNCARRTKIFVKWGDNHLREQLFCREERRVLSGWNKEMGALLGKFIESQEVYVEK